MTTIRREHNIKRNDKCVCGSNKKFKRCCSPTAPVQPVMQYIDAGETAVRWVICNRVGTALFADKDNRALVFKSKDMAYAMAQLEEFSSQDPGDINVSGVGETKWAHLQEIIPFIEIDDIEEASRLLRERIAAKLAFQEPELTPTSVEGPTNVE
ncbi:SEC-C metal-binding domain-containing protein [Sphingorhabdus sp.]|uniref:SEC-C metal-binding domain-containing protein n=1 Tax=Sphingorhabdus sp. TaxID=1902408 RepID=UPI00333E1FFD